MHNEIRMSKKIPTLLRLKWTFLHTIHKKTEDD